MGKRLTIDNFFKIFPDDEACIAHLFELRFGLHYACPNCGKAGTFHKLPEHLAYICDCGHHLFPLQGTIFENSEIPLAKWFYAIYVFTMTRRGFLTIKLKRQLGVSYLTAFRMARVIRKRLAKGGQQQGS